MGGCSEGTASIQGIRLVGRSASHYQFLPQQVQVWHVPAFSMLLLAQPFLDLAAFPVLIAFPLLCLILAFPALLSLPAS